MTRIDLASLADHLAAASLEGAAIVAFAWVAFRLMPAVSPAVRTVVWWLAALKFVLALLPLPAVSLPVLPAALRPDHAATAPRESADVAPVTSPALAFPRRAGHASRDPGLGSGDPGSATRDARLSPVHARGAATAAGAGPTGPHPGRRDAGHAPPPLAPATAGWRSIVLLVWAAVLAVHAIRLGAASRRLGRLLAGAVPWSAAERAAVAPLARRLGLRRVPEIRTSADVDAPLVAGIRRPVVIVPAGRFTRDERAMMLAHELMHVRRRDLAWGWIPAGAERLFFFHPLAHLAAREYLVAREAACDAAVVRALGVASADYGRLLLRVGVSRAEPVVAGAASRSLSSLRRRLEMLHLISGTRAPRAAWAIVLAVAALLPLQLGARQAPQVPRETIPATESPAAPAPAQGALEPSSPSPAQRVVVPDERSAAPGVDAMLRAIEEQSRRGGGRESTIGAAIDPYRTAQGPEVVHVLQWQAAIDAQREIERSLQELAAEIEQVRARQLRDAAERLLAAEAAGLAASAAAQREAIFEALEAAQASAARAPAEQASGPDSPASAEVVREQLDGVERAVREAISERPAATDAIREQIERAVEAASVARDIEEQLARANRTLIELEEKGLSDAHPDVAAAKRRVMELQQERAARAARPVERAPREPRGELAATMRARIEQLHREQEALVEQLQQLTAQQQALIEAQRRLSDAAERIRRELEQR
jgi:beta-lactamase regulating signal transducer with metallopeptidase domain